MLKLMVSPILAMWPMKKRFRTDRGAAYRNFVGRLRRLFDTNGRLVSASSRRC